MAVTKQVYTAAATWTASGLADIFRSAFIDAALMSEWHDSFLNTVENRVLAVDYGTGAYSLTYYWFQFTTSGVFYSNTSGWTAASDVPTGTQYLDFFSAATNSTSNHVQFLALSTSTTVTLTRYTSGTHTFFVLRSGANYYTFGIDHAGVSLQSWVDLDKGYHNGLVRASCFVGFSAGQARFSTPFRCRRSILDGCMNNGSTSLSTNYSDEQTVSLYSFLGGASANANNPATLVTDVGLVLPYVPAAGNPAFATDFNPVYTGIRHLSTVAANLPADFGLTASRTNNANTIQDTLTVSPGVEVWEVIAFANASSAAVGNSSPLFLARTT